MVPLQRHPQHQDTLRNRTELCLVSRRRDRRRPLQNDPTPSVPAPVEPGNQAAKVRTPVFLLSPGRFPHPKSLSTLQLARPLNPPSSGQFSHSVVSDSVTPRTAARHSSLSITNSRSLLKLMPIELVMPSNHLVLFSSRLQSFPASGSFPMSLFFTPS